MKREQLINKIYNFLDTCSDTQLAMLNKLIIRLMGTEEWTKNEPPEIPVPTGNSNGLGMEDAEEGTHGSLYRSPDNQ